MRKADVYGAHEAIAERINLSGGRSLHHDVESVLDDFKSLAVLRNLHMRPYGMLDHMGQ
jgi:hypothetical protein